MKRLGEIESCIGIGRRGIAEQGNRTIVSCQGTRKLFHLSDALHGGNLQEGRPAVICRLQAFAEMHHLAEFSPDDLVVHGREFRMSSVRQSLAMNLALQHPMTALKKDSVGIKLR